MQKKIKSIGKTIHKSWPILLICFLITGSLYYLTFKHYQNFGGSNDLIFTLESKLLDLRFVTRGPKKPNKNIGILAIDEKAIKKFGRFPFSRRYYGQAFKNLKNLGVSWIGFDAIFSEPEKAGYADLRPHLDTLYTKKNVSSGEIATTLQTLQNMEKVSPGDREFQEGISAFGNIVMGFFYYGLEAEVKEAGRVKERFVGLDKMAEASSIQNLIIPEGKKLSDYKSLKIPGMLANTPFLSEATPHYGFFSNDPDYDAISRWVTLMRTINGQLMPSLALKVAAEADQRDIAVFFDKNGVESISLVNRQNDSDTIDIPLDPDGQGRILLNHRGPGKKMFHHYSLADAYDNSFTAKEIADLKGSILLLGATQIGGNDQRPNPFDPALDGVENHAAVIDNILSKDFLKRPASIYSIELYIIMLIGLIFAPLLIFTRAMYSGIVAVIFLVGYYLFDRYFLFNTKGIWAYMGVPFIEISLLFITGTLYKYITEEKEKKKVRGVFSHYLSPDVIAQVLENPEALKLGGEKKELTVFFSDVRGFTTISESLTPEKLCEFMNDYFTPMTRIVLKTGGVLDKYIGDAIMAFWGAPLPILDHADQAALACLEMMNALDAIQLEFMARGLPKIDIGMGLNTGAMAVGNMGSLERFCYTVMGDAVNLSARLEGLTKEYGVKILISEFTHKSLTPGRFLTRELDDIRVKGKNEPVRVFEIMRPNFLKQQEKITELVETFAAGRGSYLCQDWAKAEKYFLTCLAIKPDDGPSELYLERVTQYKKENPGAGWDGIYTFKHK